MKFLLFSGSHARHVYVHEQLLDSDDIEVAGVVTMRRESSRPSPPPDWPEHDRELFRRHFERRAAVERDRYGDRSIDRYDRAPATMTVKPDELNTHSVAEFVEEVNPEACFVFGTGLILDPVLQVLPEWTLNFHLGLSPRYRGSATLFWPFYFLEPQFVGGTLHQIIEEPDAGPIVHQTTPDLEPGQGLHEVAANTLVRFCTETHRLLEHLSATGNLPTEPQSNGGKLFLRRDFDPHHLRVVYDLYEEGIVDAYLAGHLGDRTPTIVDAFERLPVDRPT